MFEFLWKKFFFSIFLNRYVDDFLLLLNDNHYYYSNIMKENNLILHIIGPIV